MNALFVMGEEVADHRPALVVSTVTTKSFCVMLCHVAGLAVFVVEFPTMCLESGALQRAMGVSEPPPVALELPSHCSSMSRRRVGRIQVVSPFARVEDLETKTGTLCAILPHLGLVPHRNHFS